MSEELEGGGNKPINAGGKKFNLSNIGVKQRNVMIIVGFFGLIAALIGTSLFSATGTAVDTSATKIEKPHPLSKVDNSEDDTIKKMVDEKNTQGAKNKQDFAPIMIGALKTDSEFEDFQAKKEAAKAAPKAQVCSKTAESFTMFDDKGNPITFFDANGNMIGLGNGGGVACLYGKDGKLITNKNIAFDADGKPILDGVKIYDKNGKPLGVFGGKVGSQMVYDADGNPIMMYDKGGRPIFTKDGTRIYYDKDGNALDENGRPMFAKDGTQLYYDSNGIAVDKNGRRMFDTRGNRLYYDKDGNPVDKKGNPLLDDSGRPLHYNAKGQLVDADGNIFVPKGVKPGYPVNSSGEVVGPDGKVLLGSDGKPLRYNADGELVDSSGNLVDINGRKLYDKSGNRLYYDESGGPVDIDGKPLLGSDGKPLRYNADGELVDSSGNLVDINGNLIDASGAILYDRDGKRVYYDKSGNPVDKYGNKLYFDDKVKLVKAVPVTKIKTTRSGIVYDADGNPIMILDENGNPKVMFDKNGNSVSIFDKFGNMIAGLFASKDSQKGVAQKKKKKEDSPSGKSSSDMASQTGIKRFDGGAKQKSNKVGIARMVEDGTGAAVSPEEAIAQKKKRKDAKDVKLAMMKSLSENWMAGSLPAPIFFADKEVAPAAPAALAEAAQVVTTPVTKVEKKKAPLFIRAGEILYAFNTLETNSDYKGPVILEGLDPRISGMKFIADGFELVGEALVISPTKMITKYKTVGVTTYVLNPKTDATVVASEVDKHYFERWGSFLLVEGLSAYANIITAMNNPSPNQPTPAPVIAAPVTAPVAIVAVTGTATADPTVITQLAAVTAASNANNAPAAIAAANSAVAAAASAAALATLPTANVASAQAAAAASPTVQAQLAIVAASATPATAAQADSAAIGAVIAAESAAANLVAQTANNAANAAYAAATTTGVINTVVTPAYSLSEQGWLIAGNAIEKLKEPVGQNMNRPHTVYLHRNDTVAIMFMEDVFFDPKAKR